MTDLVALKAANEQHWKNARLTRGSEFARPAKVAFDNKSRYAAIAARAGMPAIAWVFIACSHYRESNANFNTNLGQGDPLRNKAGVPIKTIHVPAGRGPFDNFEDAAVDALVNCSPYAARLKDWSIGGMLTNLERYNGLGYASKGRPSPYIWAGTDQYRSGKYVRDGVYDPDAIDQQLGCAGLIMAIMQLDPTVRFDGLPHVNDAPTIAPAGPEKDGAWLQTSLNKLGAQPPLTVDGIVGPGTRNAVRAFQLAQGIAVDGLVGPQTFDAIDKALAAGKPVPTIPVPPDIVLPPPGSQAHADLAPTFWGRVMDLFKPKEH